MDQLLETWFKERSFFSRGGESHRRASCRPRKQVIISYQHSTIMLPKKTEDHVYVLSFFLCFCPCSVFNRGSDYVCLSLSNKHPLFLALLCLYSDGHRLRQGFRVEPTTRSRIYGTQASRRNWNKEALTQTHTNPSPNLRALATKTNQQQATTK